ncbi:MAG TPA: alpha-ketoglutarate-dependent dioxygenase AlkB [Candidatus Paceibacterota bacterium]
MARAGDQYRLFDTGISLPNGFVYRPEFLTIREEERLLAAIKQLPLVNAPYGEYTARRRVMNFGMGFEFDMDKPTQGPPLPPFLTPLQRKVAKWIDVPAARVVEALVTEYRPGTPIGWHRDREMFESVVGVSLSGWCDLKLRPIGSKGLKDIATLPLEPRSAYLLQEDSRWKWQHSIPPTKTLRYSITFRTLPKSLPTPR